MSAEVIEAVSGRVPESVPEPARRAILAWYADRGRPLAFRRTTDPYAILVSEVMAQQTQAVRAAAYWERFLARFPTVEDLAAATPADVLREWQGLGYDRRALALWRAAGEIVRDHGGTVPDDVATLESLPGIGPSLAVHDAARRHGIPLRHGGMLESGIGRAHNLHLATLPGFTLAGDIAGRRSFSPELIDPPIDMQAGGVVAVPEGAGIGVDPVPSRLDTATIHLERFNA